MSTWEDESLDLFVDSLNEWPSGFQSLEYNGCKMDVVKSAVKKSFTMNGVSYVPGRDCQIDCSQDDFTLKGVSVSGITKSGLINDWQTSSRDKRPNVLLNGEKFKVMDMDNDSADPILKIYLKASI